VEFFIKRTLFNISVVYIHCSSPSAVLLNLERAMITTREALVGNTNSIGKSESHLKLALTSIKIQKKKKKKKKN